METGAGVISLQSEDTAVNPKSRGGRGQRTFLILFRFSESGEKCTEKANAIVVFQIYA